MKQKPTNLAEYLKRAGLTQAQFAASVGVHQPTISKLIRGAKRPSLRLALKIAAAAGIPVESLVSNGRAA
jgi:DNA-binding XRE family transcriptional regulator